MSKNRPYLIVKDYSVSGEMFQLIKNNEFGFLETTPQPTADNLPGYYKSEDYISHTDTKRNLFEKVYHLVRTITLKRKLKLINSYRVKEKKLLDIGCGTGDFLEIALKNKWQVLGIEPSEKAREIANKKSNNKVFDIPRLKEFSENSFDVITLWHVLEHLPKLEEHVLILKKLLKPDGKIIIAVPNYKSYDAKHYKEFWAAYDAPRHLWHFSQSSMQKLFQKFDMSIVGVLPLKFDSFYVSLLSEKYISGKMNFIKAFWIGLLSNVKAKKSREYSSLIYVLENIKN